MGPLLSDQEYKQYRKSAVSRITRGLSFFIIAGFAINSLWFFWDSFRKIFVQEIFLVGLLFISLLTNWAARKRDWEIGALRFYTVFGYLAGMFFIFTAGDDYLFTGILLLTLFALISIFSLNRRESILWCLLSLAAGIGALVLRYYFSPVDSRYDGRHLMEIYLFMALMTGLLLFLAYTEEGIVKDYIGRLLRESEAVETLLRREKELKDKYRTVFTMIPDLLFIMDRQGRILDGNRAMLAFTGLSEEELRNLHVLDFLPRVNQDMIDRIVENVLEGKEPEELEVQVFGSDEEDLFFDMSLSPVEENGRVDRILVLARDITERKKMEMLEKSRKEELYRQSITDSLTGLNNRLRLDDFLATEINTAFRYDSVFSLILCDIDYFKKVNDTYGHSTGDEVLRDVALIIRNNIRRTDLAGRWGGEEFLIVCPRTPQKDALVLAEKIRQSIEKLRIRNQGHVTLSLGIAEYREGDDMNRLMERADRALYRAKETGRNRSVLL